jgi:hypothetical protein
MKNGFPPVRSRDPVADSRHRCVRAQKLLQELAYGFYRKRQQRDALVVGSLRPRGVELRAEVHHEQASSPGGRLYENVDKRLAARIEPVEIFEKGDCGLSTAQRLRHALHGRKELPAARVGIDSRGRVFGIGNAEELERDRQCLS